ncbi:hypothetical protein MAPG_05420 [Magnaporthiopsis poae ATCC 64411]|uniref:F-box domain-containing protein n=1 Tax=Magnaporthiopsis poae (strain ATCC 64411 / 73-15) TaxID=644358 RepID=A0A0C4DZC5_MAGP6|nr:hypothetical protein MAPG_05420 [Magnaporthiopsis poae ATCC 64411]
MSIRRLPWEIVSYVVQDLDLDDFVSLSLSCRHFQSLLRDDNICRRLLESRVPSSPESQSALKTKNYARELRKLVKRRAAISSASPYLVAVVADAAESFVYNDGVLCYLSEGRLRVLDLVNSATQEIAVDVHKLLCASPGLPSPKEDQVRVFKLVHYSHGFVTCRYSHRKSVAGWIVVINLAKGRVFSHALESAHRLIARNDGQFLYYGTHTDISDTGHRRWEMRGCDLQDETWFEHKLRLTDIVGSEVGKNICFEIIDGYFYCVANQALFEREEIAWTSYYTYLRFPVNRPRPRNVEAVEPEEIWRRFHAEGPIDDRWTFLRLTKNESTGALTVVEGRKEWTNASSKSRRTYYSSELLFPDQDERASSEDHTQDLWSRPGPGTSSGQIEDSPKSEMTQSQARCPHQVHPGDDASTPWSFTVNNSLMLSYHLSCQSHLDLVNDPLPSDPYRDQRLRLRVGSRRRRLRSEAEEPEAAPKSLSNNPSYPESEIHKLYKTSDIVLWPPSHWEQEHGAAAVGELYSILNPPGYRGDVSAVWDERSFCYATGQDRQAIVFVSFDSSIRLRGIRRWRGGVGEGSEAVPAGRREVLPDGAILTPGMQDRWTEGRPGSPGANGEVQVPPATSTKGKSKAVWSHHDSLSLSSANVTSPAAPVLETGSGSAAIDAILASAEESREPRWIWAEKPRYSVIQKGFHFAS